MESQEQTEQTYRLDANDLSTIFKRIGKYDRIRREVLETFKDNVEGRDFASTIRSYSEKFLNNTAGLRQLDRNTLQRRLIKDLESRKEIFDNVERTVEKRLLHSATYRAKIESELRDILSNPENLEQDKNDDNDDDGQIGQRNLRNQESPALKPRQKVRQDQSIIMDILGMAPTVKQSSSTAEQSITKKKKLTHKPAAEGETIAQTQKRDDGDDVVKDNTAAVVGSPQMDMMDIEEPDSTRKRKRSHIEQTETFSIGQKLAACIKAEDGEERYLVVIVQTELDDATGMYTVRDPEARKGEQETWLLPPEKLIRFDYTEKQFSVGERVQSLFRGASNRRGGGVSSVFYPATVSRMAGNVVHVKFDDGDVAVMKLDELFSVEK